MQTFVLKTMDGNRYSITEEEYKNAIIGDGLLVIKSQGITINKSRIEAIYPEVIAEKVEPKNKRDQLIGLLADGVRVRKYFGEWVDAYAQEPDDSGHYRPVKIDPHYYPEVAHDCVPTPEEFAKIAHLPVAERRKLILGNTTERQAISFKGEPTKIVDLLPHQ